MHKEANSVIEARAIDWVIRQRSTSFDDWDGFADWLAENPAHAPAYDIIASLDSDLDALPAPVSVPVIQIPQPRARPTRRFWMGGALAAALVGAISLSVIAPGDNSRRIATAAGEHRTVQLTDGSRIDLNGASVVRIDEDRPRFASIESGEAMFHIVHRTGDPFIVEAGAAKIVDLGTAFNVVRRTGGLSVAVSEGVVAFNPARQNIRVDAGNMLVAPARGAPLMQRIDAASIGGWRNGQLVYSGAPLSDVIQDLNRTAGIVVTVDPAVAPRSFRGALIVGDDTARTVHDLAALSGVHARKTAEGWMLTR